MGRLCGIKVTEMANLAPKPFAASMLNMRAAALTMVRTSMVRALLLAAMQAQVRMVYLLNDVDGGTTQKAICSSTT